jgi:hypothetical protein
VAEIFNRTIMMKVRAMLISSSLARRYWGEALTAAVYIYNRTPHSSLPGSITPYEAKTGSKPDISGIKIWGSIAWKVAPLDGLPKLAPRAYIGILIGYNHNQYRILNPRTRRTTWARDVYIQEGKFPKDKPDIKPGDEPDNDLGDYPVDQTVDPLYDLNSQPIDVPDGNTMDETGDPSNNLEISPELTSINDFI